MSRSDHGTMLLVGTDEGWRVRITVDDGTEIETKHLFATREEARAWGFSWCRSNGIATETIQ